MMGLSTAKLIGLAIAAAAILSFVLLAFHWKSQAADRREKLEIICKTTREAADNPKLGCGSVPEQIGALGASVKNLKAGIAAQNAAVNALAAESDRQKAAASQAVLRAATRAHEAESTVERLRASSRSTVAPSAPCKPSRTVEEIWK
jgi:Sec-independent protein translocase protein TatA